MFRPANGAPGINDGRDPLFGRQRERDILRQHVDAAINGNGSLALISGEAGMGKTSLVRTLAEDAQATDVFVRESACYDLTITPPYGPWLEIFRSLGNDTLPAPLPDTAAEPVIEHTGSRDALFAEAKNVLSSACHAVPHLLVLEDIHWADSASLEFLRYIARQVRDLPILVVATYRDTELGRHHPLNALLPALVRESGALRVRLRPLDDHSVSALVQSRYDLVPPDSTRLVTYLQQRTEGNPFFIGELIRSLEEAGGIRQHGNGWQLVNLNHTPVPALVRQALDSRLDRLSGGERRLLATAAVLGQDVSLDIWTRVSQSSSNELSNTIQRATELHVLEEAATSLSLRFTHALVREALYYDLPLPERRQLHLAIAGMLESEPRSDPDAIAYHYRQARDDRALEWLTIAGDRAQRLYAWRTAAERFESVLELIGTDSSRLQVRGWLSYRTGMLLTYADTDRAIDHLQTAERIGESVGDKHLAAYARADRGLIRCLTGDVRRGLSEMRRGVTDIDALPPLAVDGEQPGPDDPLSIENIQRGSFMMFDSSPDVNTRRGSLVFWLAWSGRYEDAVTMGEEFVERVPETSRELQDSLGDALAGLGHAYAALGNPKESLTCFSHARDAFGTIDHHFKVGNTAIYELSEAFLPYRADRIMEREWLADQAEAG